MSAARRKQLLAWYDQNARDLPWRHTRDPYAIWVSEIMLQQTRVDTVIPYYARFLERFPTPELLASASEDDVLAAWSGLGYYRRARLLHRGVREVVESYGGGVPVDREARLSLPGVGRYTAGAIGSIAFELAEPIVDGNVARVLTRLLGIETPLGRADTEKRLWAEAESLVRGERPGDLNQALMELGATVCTPRSPSCGECPWRRGCSARREGATERLPIPRSKKKPLPISLAAVVAMSGRGAARRYWLARGERALFGGLWSPPLIEAKPADASAARRAMKSAGVSARLEVDPIGEIRHTLSHRLLTVTVYRATAARGASSGLAGFHTPDEMNAIGVATLTRKILRIVD